MSRLIVQIKDRTSAGTAGRPGLPRRIFHVQNRPKPLRCQPITVAGLINDGTRLPIRPSRRQPGPLESISGRQLRPLHRALQNTELMTEGQTLKLKRRSLAKKRQESRRQRHQQRRTSESKEGRRPPIYQQLRGLRERESPGEGGRLSDTSGPGRSFCGPQFQKSFFEQFHWASTSTLYR